jgi:hypothetical protein
MTVPDFKTTEQIHASDLPTLDLGQPDRQLSPKEALQAWEAAFGAGELDPHQMKGYRTVMGWRLTRVIAFKQGRLHLDQRLAEAFPEQKAWVLPAVAPTTKRLLGANSSRPQDQWALPDLLARNGGIAIAPTRATAEQHANTVAKLADSMWLQRGSKQFPRLGHYGLHGLTAPETVEEFWPKRAEILAFEDKVIDQIQGLVLKWSRRKIQAHLRDMFDLTVKEIGGLVALATEEAKIEATQDVETIRHIMAGRTEDYIDRMRECADSSNEMKGLKLLCAIQGLHKADPENTAEMLIGVIAKVASDRAIDPSPMRITASQGDDDEHDSPLPKTGTPGR